VSTGDEFEFLGFSSPTYTQVPDEVFDQLLPVLKEAEIKVLLYIIRRTFGFKKTADDISFNQFLKGITTRDGRQLDHGCGVKSSSTLNAALKSLEAKRIIHSRKLVDHKGAPKTTTYALRFRDQEQVRNPQHPTAFAAVPPLRLPQYPPADPAVPVLRDPQEQETEEQETDPSKLRKAEPQDYDESREVLLPYVQDVAREFRDTSPVASTLTRVVRMQRAAGLDDDEFLERWHQARQMTKERTSAVKGGEPGRREMVPYFLAILEDLTKTG